MALVDKTVGSDASVIVSVVSMEAALVAVMVEDWSVLGVVGSFS